MAKTPKKPNAIQREIDSVAAGATHKPLPGSFRLLWRAVQIVKNNWKLLLGMALIYMALNLVLVQGLYATSNLTTTKNTLQIFSDGSVRNVVTDGVSLYAYLIGSSGSSVAPTAGAYQFILALIMSLAIIWTLRQIYAGRETRIRDGFYYGMYPFVTYFLVLLMVIVHLLPFALGTVVYGVIASNGLAATPIEATSFLLVFLGLLLVSLYLLCSSIFALYIVTLPEVTPMAALRSARDLVVHRRWTIMRKVLFLPLALLVLGGVVLIPVALFATALAPWIFTGVAAVGLVLMHSYLYALYRSML